MRVAETFYPELAARHGTLFPGSARPAQVAPNASPAVREARINIQDLRLRTFIGFNDEEKSKQQDVVINIEIVYALKPGVFNDQVDDALDYKRLTKRVIALVEDGRFLLLEKLAGDVLDVCSEHADIQRACVRIDKPHALRFADSVSVTLAHNASKHSAMEERQ